MAIKKFGDYESTQGYQDRPQLPTGGYVMKIMGAEVKENSVGQYVQVSMDIAEGQYKDFFAEDYRAQDGSQRGKVWHCTYLLNVPLDDGSEKDGWTKRRFKTFTEALEASNDGYHFDWDEKKFKGLMIGGLFNIREWKTNDGRRGKRTNLAQVCSVEKIRTGKYKLPKDQLLPDGSAEPSTNSEPSGGYTVVHDDDLPF